MCEGESVWVCACVCVIEIMRERDIERAMEPVNKIDITFLTGLRLLAECDLLNTATCEMEKCFVYPHFLDSFITT